MRIVTRIVEVLRAEVAYWRDPDRAEKNREADAFHAMTEAEYDTYLNEQWRRDRELAAARDRERTERMDSYLDWRSAGYDDKRNEQTIGKDRDVRT